MEFKDRLKEARKFRYLTQVDIANQMNIKQQQYSKYERGINIMTVGTFTKLCLILKVSSEYLLGFTNFPKEIKIQKKTGTYYNKRLKYAREYKGYSETKIAKYVGISIQQYNDYERGDYEMSIKYLTKICECINISPDYILGFINEMKPLDKNKRD